MRAYVSVCVCMCIAIDKIEALQEHENEEVYAQSLEIISKYFTNDEVSSWIFKQISWLVAITIS